MEMVRGAGGPTEEVLMFMVRVSVDAELITGEFDDVISSDGEDGKGEV